MQQRHTAHLSSPLSLCKNLRPALVSFRVTETKICDINVKSKSLWHETTTKRLDLIRINKLTTERINMLTTWK